MEELLPFFMDEILLGLAWLWNMGPNVFSDAKLAEEYRNIVFLYRRTPVNPIHL